MRDGLVSIISLIYTLEGARFADIDDLSFEAEDLRDEVAVTCLNMDPTEEEIDAACKIFSDSKQAKDFITGYFDCLLDKPN